jgi:hypothetical protein
MGLTKYKIMAFYGLASLASLASLANLANLVSIKWSKTENVETCQTCRHLPNPFLKKNDIRLAKFCASPANVSGHCLYLTVIFSNHYNLYDASRVQ